jgi:hypothetical protein
MQLSEFSPGQFHRGPPRRRSNVTSILLVMHLRSSTAVEKQSSRSRHARRLQISSMSTAWPTQSEPSPILQQRISARCFSFANRSSTPQSLWDKRLGSWGAATRGYVYVGQPTGLRSRSKRHGGACCTRISCRTSHHEGSSVPES